MPVSWSDDLTVGVTLIDEQHKELFKAVDDLSDAMWQGQGKEAVSKLVNFLADYVVEHFGAEERLMVKNEYPLYESHRALHVKFLQDFAEFRKKFEAGEVTSELVIKVLDGTCDWLRVHIKGTDKALGKFLQEK
jgi:hemerythrin